VIPLQVTLLQKVTVPQNETTGNLAPAGYRQLLFPDLFLLMSSSQSGTSPNAIDEALSSVNLEKLSTLIYESQSSSASTGSPSDTESSDAESSGNEFPNSKPPDSESSDREKPGSETDASSPEPASEAEPEEVGSERNAPGETLPPNDETSSKRESKSTARGSSPSRKTSQPGGSSRTEVERPVERPSFTIYADQAATLRVLAGSKADPLGITASEIAGRALDLLGYNGRHPAAALHGRALSGNASAPGPLIEKRQWKDLLAKADEMATALNTLHDESPEGEYLAWSLDEDEARLACVCYLVQEALYEAGFGDRRRRRKGPF